MKKRKKLIFFLGCFLFSLPVFSQQQISIENVITLPSGVKGTLFVNIMTENEVVTKKIVVQR